MVEIELPRRPCVVLYRLIRRTSALGFGTRPACRVCTPGPPVYTDLEADPQKILSWFVMRWQLEVTFQEMRRHLGFETQRQWSELAIRRTTPALLGLFSFITLLAHGRMVQAASVFRQTAWYHKRHPTFTDALAVVRKELWAQETFYGSSVDTETVKVPRAFMEQLTDTLCYAA
jgi:hypothetical protein